jgi:hypothetical protein
MQITTNRLFNQGFFYLDQSLVVESDGPSEHIEFSLLSARHSPAKSAGTKTCSVHSNFSARSAVPRTMRRRPWVQPPRCARCAATLSWRTLHRSRGSSCAGPSPASASKDKGRNRYRDSPQLPATRACSSRCFPFPIHPWEQTVTLKLGGGRGGGRPQGGEGGPARRPVGAPPAAAPGAGAGRASPRRGGGVVDPVVAGVRHGQLAVATRLPRPPRRLPRLRRRVRPARAPSARVRVRSEGQHRYGLVAGSASPTRSAAARLLTKSFLTKRIETCETVARRRHLRQILS